MQNIKSSNENEIKTNDKKILELYNKAKNGDMDAQNEIGTVYAIGIGVKQNYYEAEKWCRKSAEQGYAAAQYNLALMYIDGTGVEQNYHEAVKWYKKSAEQGDAKAQFNLGGMYEDGAGVEQNNYEAVKWYRKAAEQGLANAQCNLGVMYYNGTGVKQNKKEALKWYKKSAEQGDVNAQNNLVRMSRSARKETSGCFIATAVYNSPTAPKVMILREFRDQQLLTSKFGSLFVQFYYRNSPPIAEFLSRNKFFSEMVRVMVIEPFVYVVKLFFGGISKKVR